MELNVLFTRLANSEIPMEQRGPVIEFLLAKEIAYRMPLPASKLDDVRMYYGTNHGPLVKNMVSCVNEGFPIDVLSTVELAYRIWMYRYSVCHCSSSFGQRFVDQSDMPPRYAVVREIADTEILVMPIIALLNDKFGEV